MDKSLIEDSFISSSDRRIANDYYRWLLETVNYEYYCNKVEDSYSKLFKHLHKTEFRYFIHNDDNRAEDGKILREEFESVTDYNNYDILDSPCSMLEMLVALSKRVSFEIEEMDVSECFWMLLKNLGIDNLNDTYYDGIPGYLDMVLSRLNDRTYDFDGRGGLFPLNNPEKDQRKVEIWYQMQAFVIENYEF